MSLRRRDIRGRVARSPFIDDIRHRALRLISLAGREGCHATNVWIEHRGFVEGQQGSKVGGHEADELGQDHGAGDGAAAARESFGIDITAGPGGGFYPVDGDGQSRTLEELLGHLSLEHSAHARQAPQIEIERIADI